MNKYHALILLNALISSISQIMLNLSSKEKHKSKIFEYMNVKVIGAYVLFVIVLMNVTYALRFIPMKEANAIQVLTYVFVPVLSKIVLKEQLTKKKVIGNIIIITGVLVFVT